MTLYADVVGQDRAVAELRAAAAAPVHAYLLLGPPGSGKRTAARSFAASLLCRSGGCGACRDCLLALADVHPDVEVVERTGPYITVEQAREIVRKAMRTPVEGRRKVLVLVDFHLVREAGPTLLKVIEEPPPGTVFVVLAEHVPPELVTIASRCVRVELGPVPASAIVEVLVAEGVDSALADEVAVAAGGRLDRARLLASDPEFSDRRSTWKTVPARLDGTGAAAAVAAAELSALVATAAVAPLEARHAAEAAELAERVERSGERGAGRKELEERHRRELRRLRMDELRFGLATLAGAYRDALAAGGGDARRQMEAVTAIQKAAEALLRNPNETLLLQALLLKLPALAPQ